MGAWRKPRTTAYVPDEVADLEQVVAFYEARLEQALERLGEAIDAREQRKKALRRSGGA